MSVTTKKILILSAILLISAWLLLTSSRAAANVYPPSAPVPTSTVPAPTTTPTTPPAPTELPVTGSSGTPVILVVALGLALTGMALYTFRTAASAHD